MGLNRFVPMNDFTNIDPAGLQELKSGGNIVLVDVRGDQEVVRGVIPGARHIPLHLLPYRFEEIGRSQPVVFYCQSGARSAQASYFLSGKGWPEVYNLAGGIAAWAGRGLPIASLE